MQCRLLGFADFGEDSSGLLTKVNEVPMPLKQLDEWNVGLINYELKIDKEKLISYKVFFQKKKN